ncbi:ASCH domain-containing protein [Carbonactinospora thermoautotrophica]|uniref:ASCH domain-containing protein n=1 Tax=Carbonactinospora thermoautotrophica TaxID=1469144 RepID=A0A132MRM8_9ACTN|nr:hypothetical protein TH66_14590 [Carbonactinospora thermoautotrophica]KWX07530.1 hypothetical protein TR74_18520 [Carbonactinospora thermoautotrophica]MCX9189833.1 ASCH domain-containing protein [Carbonactinospora thermoautotrophica]
MLLSLHPRFATSILEGTKSVELRRQRIPVPPGTTVILYATAPVMAVVGTARVAEVHVAEPDDVWSSFHAHTALTREEFDQYMAGASQACALLLTDVEQLPTPVPLAHLRSSQPFHPPQSYRYLASSVLRQLVDGHPMASRILRQTEATPS